MRIEVWSHVTEGKCAYSLDAYQMFYARGGDGARGPDGAPPGCRRVLSAGESATAFAVGRGVVELVVVVEG